MSEIKLIFVGITIFLTLLLVALELLFPAREYRVATKKQSYFTNLMVFAFNNVITIALQISAVFALVLLYSPSASYFATLPIWVQGILGILLLDFGIWLWHLLSHKVPFLWAFHKCHHSEQYLNATSALRFHIGEILLSAVWKAGLLILLGIPLWVFVLSEFFVTAFAMFHHANIELSPRARRIVEAIIISPYIHRVHHSDIQDEHDSNYGVIFSWWDTLFDTSKRVIPKRIGLQGIDQKNFWSFLWFPLRKK